MMSTFLIVFVVVVVCFVGLGVGVLFFGKSGDRDSCGSVPKAQNEDCPSQKAGLCPVEDKSGILKLLAKLKLHK